MKTTYRFVSLQPWNTDYGYNKLYVDAFVNAMNERDYVKHRNVKGEDGKPLAPVTQGWSYGLAPRHFDGRVTTRRCSWVFGRVDQNMPEGACAMVFFTTEAEPIGFLVKEAVDSKNE